MNEKPSMAKIIVTLLCGALLGTSTWVFAETMYVKVGSAQIRSGKTSQDPVVAWVRFGEKVETSDQQDNFVLVKTSTGSQGWIFSSKLSPTQPSAEDESALRPKFTKSTPQSPSATTASGGARGLDKVAEGYAKEQHIAQQHQDAVDRMTAQTATDEEVDRFMKEGGLGEYRK